MFVISSFERNISFMGTIEIFLSRNMILSAITYIVCQFLLTNMFPLIFILNITAFLGISTAIIAYRQLELQRFVFEYLFVIFTMFGTYFHKNLLEEILRDSFLKKIALEFGFRYFQSMLDNLNYSLVSFKGEKVIFSNKEFIDNFEDKLRVSTYNFFTTPSSIKNKTLSSANNLHKASCHSLYKLFCLDSTDRLEDVLEDFQK